MKKQIEQLVHIEVVRSEQNLLYQLLGKFGDKLSDEVKKDIRDMAEERSRHIDKKIKSFTF